MNIDLGMVRFSLPDEASMAPVMFIAMGEKDEAPTLSVGPTMAKSTSQQFRKTLTMNLSARGEDEEMGAALLRVAGELITRVRGKKGGSADKNVGDASGLLIEFTHEGHAKTALRSVCWVGCRERAIVTLNLTGLAQKGSDATMGKMMNEIVESVTL